MLIAEPVALVHGSNSGWLFAWWQTIDWGNASEWFGSLFTGATLLVTVLLVAQDRKRERQKAPDSFVVSSETVRLPDQDDDFPYGIKVRAINTGTVPIVNPNSISVRRY